MKWLEIRTQVEAEVADDIAAFLARYSRGGPVIEEDLSSQNDGKRKPLTVKAYLPVDRALPTRRRRLAEGLGHLSLLYPLQVEERWLEETDWAEAWKIHFFPHRVGRRLVVKPSWREYQPAPGEIVLVLDPGMAFGTGLHPSTRLCLQALEGHLKPGQKVLDLGTGSGILALAAARLGARRVLALDIDPIAVRVARDNVRANELARVISVRRGSLPGAAPREAFDLVVANIVAQVIQELALPLAESLRPGGLLVAGGIVSERLEDVVAALLSAGLTPSQVLAEGDWRTVVALARNE